MKMQCALAAALALSITPARDSGRPAGIYILRYRFAPGQIDNYSFSLSIRTDTGGKESSTSGAAANVVKVLRVNPDGSALVLNEMQGFHLYGSSGGSAASSLQYTLNPLGRTRSINKPPKKLGGRTFVDPESLLRIATLLPEKQVRLGETWTNSVPNPFVGGGAVSVRSTLFREELVGATKTVRIHQRLAIPISMGMQAPGDKKFVRVKGTLKINTASNFAPGAGKIIRSNTLGSCTFVFDDLKKNQKGNEAEAFKLGIDVSLEMK